MKANMNGSSVAAEKGLLVFFCLGQTLHSAMSAAPRESTTSEAARFSGDILVPAPEIST